MDLENYKMNPFTYYNPNISDRKDREKDVAIKDKDKTIINENDSYYQQIEKKIKNKYKMLIPAIFMEIKRSKYFIEFSKDDLKNVI